MKSIRFLATTALATSIALGASTTALAQAGEQATGQTTPTEQPADQRAAEETEQEGDIVVVGSRIRRDTFNSAAPVTLITREETTLAGFASSTEALQSTAVTGGTGQINNAFGGFVTNGGPGANTLGLRGLGASRTLILLNGRRLAPAGTRGAVGSADLNVLPSAIVDRYEILKDGASSIYGSDAIAGVANIVTRSNINGITLEGSYAPTWEGGGDSYSASVVAGITGDRFSFSGSIEYGQRNSLTLADRDWTQCNTDYVRSGPGAPPGSGDFIDPATGRPKCYPITGTGSNGVTINTIGTQLVLGTTLAPGFPAPPTGFPNVACNRFRPNAAVTTGPFPGFECVGGAYFNPTFSAQRGTNLNIRDTFDPRTLNRSLISPGKFYTGYLQGSYDLQALGDAEIYFEALGARRESNQTGFRQLSLDYAIGSPLIPASLAASRFSNTPVDPQITPPGVGVGVRAFIGFGNDRSSQKVDFYRGIAGIKGATGLSDWRYDVYAGYSKSDASYTFQSFLTSRLRQSLDVVPSGSGFVCRDPSNGCVAAPALTPAVIGGQFPQDWVNYVFVPVTGTTKFDEFVANATFDGTVFEMPYGAVKAAIGFEYRWSKINDTPAAASQAADLFNLTASAITRGSDKVKEAFAEVEIPLLKNLSGAQNLTLNASARFTDYRSYGSDWTYKINGVWTPVDAVSFRATYGTSYRAPALFEQFLGATSGFLASTTDPCNALGPNSNPNRIANCAAEGIATGIPSNQGVTVFSLGGAAAGLEAETSKNLTLGVILQPNFGSAFGDLSFALDYYDIKIQNGVAQLGGGTLAALCYDDPFFRSAQSQGYCQFVTRSGVPAPVPPSTNPANTGRLTVNNSFVNIGVFNARGFDFTLRYARDIGPGRFRINAQFTEYLRQRSQIDPRFDFTEFNGTINNPRWSGVADFTYQIKEWTFRYGFDWIDSQDSYDFFRQNPATSVEILKVPDYWTHYASIRYRTDKYSIVAGVQNIFDKEPPQISSGRFNRIGNAPLTSLYDYQGRTLYVTASYTF